MELTSLAFEQGKLMPGKYTCDGQNISPDLQWGKEPEGTKSFAIICDDPDAPLNTWVHWVVFNLPADVKQLPEGQPLDNLLPNGAMQGINEFGKRGYTGPCPPSGLHRYYFKIYALDAMLDLKAGCMKKELLEAMKWHVLDYGELMVRYQGKEKEVGSEALNYYSY